MGNIVVLSTEVANQIAAGEVVERPASVIKELVENAIDAKASTIDIQIGGGGLELINVLDNGIGMDEDDLRLATRRYATSKLKNSHDLFSLGTFGFRGEALPSIASISELSIISRTKDQEYGHKAVFKAGELCDFSLAPSPLGTRIKVCDLFFNVPARLKFIKSKRAEVAFIDKLIRSFSFAYPEITFNFISDGQRIFSTLTEEDRALSLLGRDALGHMFPVKASTELIKIEGVVVAPMLSRRDSRNIHLFINNRIVNDKKLVQAIKASFRSLLEVGANPILALKITIEPSEVDVNVHPQKTETRFADERRVFSHIISLLGDFLAKTPWLSAQEKNIRDHSSYLMIDEVIRPTSAPKEFLSYEMTLKEPEPLIPMKSSMTSTLLPTRKFSELKVIGQVNTTYLLLESDEGLVIVDQHAAHERFMFEKIRAKVKDLKKEPMLIPLSVELDQSTMALFLDHADELYRLGIEAEAFSERHVIIRALPSFIKNEDARSLFMEVLNELSEIGRSDSFDTIYDGVCATLACHGSIRAGQRLSHEEIKALLEDLDAIDFGAHCPHGRPVAKSFKEAEMKKWFHRT